MSTGNVSKEILEEYYKERGRHVTTHYLKPGLVPFDYQWRAVRYMLMREQYPYYGVRGGINGQDMGMGKTLEMLLLILVDRLLTYDSRYVAVHRLSVFAQIAKERNTETPDAWSRFAHSTLVVVNDASLVVWCDNIKRHFRPNTFQYMVIESLRDFAAEPNLHTAPQVDIVFIKPHALIELYKRAPSCGLLQYKFRRLVVEEGHIARNPKTALASALCIVSATCRWIISGTIITNTHADGASMLLILQMDHPVLRKWQTNNTRCTVEALQQCGITLQFISACLFVLGLFRTKAIASDVLYIQETDPAEFMLGVLGLPPEFDIPMVHLIQYPSRSWELALVLDKQRMFGIDASAVLDLYRQYVVHTGRCRPTEVDANALELLARDLGFSKEVLQHLRQTGANAFTEASVPCMTPTRLTVRLLILKLIYNRKYCLGHPLLTTLASDVCTLQPSHFRAWRKRCVALLTVYMDACRVSQRLYGALFETLMAECMQQRAVTPSPSVAVCRSPYTFVFVRPETGHGLHIYEAFAEQLVLNARKNPTAHQNDMLSYYTFLRQVAFHPDTIIAERRDITGILPNPPPTVAAYYAQIKPPAHVKTDEQWSDWIVETAYQRHVSTKMRMLAEYYKHSVFPGERVIYFGKFCNTVRIMCAYVQHVLKVPCLCITGNDKVEKRNEILARMARGEATILCATIGICAEAFSFSWANHAIIGDTWYNATKQMQALDRINRPDQQLMTYQSIFLLQHSFDEIMYKLTGAKIQFSTCISGSAQQSQQHLIDTHTNLPVTALALRAGTRPLMTYEEYTRDVFLHSQKVNETTEQRAETLSEMRTSVMQSLQRVATLRVDLRRCITTLRTGVEVIVPSAAAEWCLPIIPAFDVETKDNLQLQYYKTAINVMATQMHL